jgi:hypothetical protein
MSNDGIKNLIPQNQRTKEEQRRIATMGGVASGEARRAKKTMREVLEVLLETVDKDSDKTNIEVMMASAVRKAMNGDLKAMEFVRDTSGQKPDTQITVKDIKTVPYQYNPDGE